MVPRNSRKTTTVIDAQRWESAGAKPTLRAAKIALHSATFLSKLRPTAATQTTVSALCTVSMLYTYDRPSIPASMM